MTRFKLTYTPLGPATPKMLEPKADALKQIIEWYERFGCDMTYKIQIHPSAYNKPGYVEATLATGKGCKECKPKLKEDVKKLGYKVTRFVDSQVC